MTVLEALAVARARTLAVTDVDDAELTRQHSPLMSPLVWDLAHIGQQEEHFLLQCLPWRDRPAAPVFAPPVAALYDAFIHPRASRVSLPLLSPDASRRCLAEVRGRVLDRLASSDPLTEDPGGDGPAFVAALVVQHEQQHVETMLAAHQLREGSRLLSAQPAPAAGRTVRGDRAHAMLVPAGPARIGANGDAPTALDNERPAHTIDLPAFRIGRVPVTNAEWLEFLADGGYAERRWWSPQGWAHRVEAGIEAPLFWSRDGAGGWTVRRFGVEAEVCPAEPVQHVCFHEAQAYARWAGGRLPTEFEWEKAATGVPSGDATNQAANLNGLTLGPAPVGSYPGSASAYGVEQLLGDVWEWTSSPLSPYPGFTPMIYETYSAPFFGPDYRVLRGGSWATGTDAIRPTFRNWDFPVRRQIFCGVRLAWDA